jgi:hypothetical protein
MLLVILGSVRSGTVRERTERRLKWTYPPGSKIIAEYWLQTPDPNVITIAETDDISSIMAGTSQWDDLITWQVVPAVTAEQGMEIAKKMMG